MFLRVNVAVSSYSKVFVIFLTCIVVYKLSMPFASYVGRYISNLGSTYKTTENREDKYLKKSVSTG